MRRRDTAKIHNVADARRLARRRLPPVVLDYVEGGADDELTMRGNLAAFEAIRFRPRAAMGRFEPDLSGSALGARLALPVLLAPCGLVRLMHPDGPAGVARAAAARGTVSVLSAVSGSPLEEVVAAAGVPLWFQLYASGGLAEAQDTSRQAADAGIEVLVVTVDTPAIGNRERDVRHGVASPLRIDPQRAVALGLEVLRRPRWALRLAASGITVRRRGPVARTLQMATSPFSWGDIERLRAGWRGRLVVKGILRGEDAVRAAEAGADGVVVSNHGGRQLDLAPSTLSVLPEVVAAAAGRIEVLVDGGVRRGAHVVAALCLGAKAVLVGRPYLYGLAAAGQPGVERVLEVFADEMRRTMVLLGCASAAELSPEWLQG